jgi:hypothetical protein
MFQLIDPCLDITLLMATEIFNLILYIASSTTMTESALYILGEAQLISDIGFQRNSTGANTVVSGSEMMPPYATLNSID